MELFVTGKPYNVLAFKGIPQVSPEPLTLAGEVINPGDCLIAIMGSKTSAGFGSFSLEQGFIRYVGTHIHQEGQDKAKCYALFAYDFPPDPTGFMRTYKAVYVGWALLSGNTLLYEIRRNARIIVPTRIIRCQE